MNIRNTIAAMLTAACAISSAHAEPFTYQGTLDDNGAPANGEYDIRFELYDAPAGGNQIGGFQAAENTLVTDGLFTAEIDFGDGAFESGPRYLRIGVRPGDSGGPFTFLDPRTRVNPAPSAQHATTADALSNPIWNQSGSVINAGDGLSRVFINREDPITPAEYFGVHAETTGFVGMYVSGPADALPFYGYSVDGNINSYTYFDPNNDAWSLANVNQTTVLTAPADNNIYVANDIIAESFQFEDPKLNYYSIAGDSFHSASGEPFIGSAGSGGAYISDPSSGWLVAPVNLPHGATVVRMRAYVDDTAAGDMTINLNRRNHGGTGASALASINTGGFFGSAIEVIDNSIFIQTINNDLYHYHMRIFSSAWPGNPTLRIKSIVIEYTVDEAD